MKFLSQPVFLIHASCDQIYIASNNFKPAFRWNVQFRTVLILRCPQYTNHPENSSLFSNNDLRLHQVLESPKAKQSNVYTTTVAISNSTLVATQNWLASKLFNGKFASLSFDPAVQWTSRKSTVLLAKLTYSVSKSLGSRLRAKHIPLLHFTGILHVQFMIYNL